MRYVANFAQYHELEKVTEFGMSLVGSSHIDVETVKKRHRVNPNIVTCLYAKRDIERKELLAYFILYPLRLKSCQDIHDLVIKNGRDINIDDILPTFNEAEGVYLGMLGGKGGMARGYIIKEWVRQIRLMHQSGKLKAVFTRWATDDGKRFAERFNFIRLQEPSEISYLPLLTSYLR